MSALAPKADMDRPGCNVCFVPKADIPRCSRKPSPKCFYLHKGAQSGDRFADDQRVHFAGALIRINGFGVGDKAANMIVQENAVAAEQFARMADRLAALDGAICFSQRCLLVGHDTLALQLPQSQHQALSRRHVAEHANQKILDQLKCRDWLAELKTLGGVSQSVLISSHCTSDREPGYARARHSQDLRRVLEAVSILQPIAFRHTTVFQS